MFVCSIVTSFGFCGTEQGTEILHCAVQTAPIRYEGELLLLKIVTISIDTYGKH